jgi:hypothetical protein
VPDESPSQASPAVTAEKFDIKVATPHHGARPQRDPRSEEYAGDDVGEPVGVEVDPGERHHERERHGDPLPLAPLAACR